jgi:hemoglobin-like flavoprotein
MKEIWISHFNRYPMMQTEDFFKMIHQSIFGPAHLLAQPDKEKLKYYLREELKQCIFFEETPLVESIGNDYFRVSIEVLKYNLMNEDALIDAFYESMLHSPKITNELNNLMRTQLEEMIAWIEENTLLSIHDAKTWLDAYMKSGFPPMHHSPRYKEIYHPHYRVVHKDFLGSLDQMMDRLNTYPIL